MSTTDDRNAGVKLDLSGPADMSVPQMERSREDMLGQLQHELEHASNEGRLLEPDEIEPTPKEELDELRDMAHAYRDSRARGQDSISVTIRMRPETIDALRLEAHRLGVRGYQTLMKRYIDDRLRHRELVSAVDIKRRLGPVLGLNLEEEVLESESFKEYYGETVTQSSGEVDEGEAQFKTHA